MRVNDFFVTTIPEIKIEIVIMSVRKPTCFKHTTSMSTTRRSARLAAKADSKTSPQPSFFIFTGPGQAGKSLVYNTLSSNKSWSLDYTIYPAETNLKDRTILDDAIVHHEALHREDTWKALSAYSAVWEHEMDVAARWLCIDNRIIKESVEMRVRAETYANRVNDLLPALYAKIDCLKMQLYTLDGCAADGVHHELLKAELLLVVAEHVHQKWNIVLNEIEPCPQNTTENFKPEMGWSSDEDDF